MIARIMEQPPEFRRFMGIPRKDLPELYMSCETAEFLKRKQMLDEYVK
jgi:hypothetical protein